MAHIKRISAPPAATVPIQAVIFDFGGVLSKNDGLEEIGLRLAKRHKADPATVQDAARRGWLQARLDKRVLVPFWREIAQALNTTVGEVKREYLAFPRPIPGSIALVRSLRKRYVVGMLSNQIASWHIPLLKRYRLSNAFDPMVTSYGEGLAKPDPRIYRRLLERLGLPAAACVYIDDRADNLPPAAALGMRVLHFTTAARLRRDLIAMGVAVS